MDSVRSPDRLGPPVAAPTAPGRRSSIAGGFGVGKTTTVGAISEIAPLTTEAEMTTAADRRRRPRRTRPRRPPPPWRWTSAASPSTSSLKLYLFGTPGQARFGFMWDDLARGALGALVVVDSAPAGRLLPGGRLLRAGRAAVRGRGQHLRRAAGPRPRRDPVGAGRRRPRAPGAVRRPRPALGAGRPAGRPRPRAGPGYPGRKVLNRPAPAVAGRR